MAKFKLKRISDNLITELAFKLILDSEEIEDYQLNHKTVATSSENDQDTNSSQDEYMHNINKEIVLEFLADKNTKITVRHDEESERNFLIASNSVSNETIKIAGLADHYLALLKMIESAETTQILKESNPDTQILTHEFIQELNLSLQAYRTGERGIGEYRPLVEYYGRKIPAEVYISTNINNRETPIRSVQLAKQKDVERLMDELLDWTNNVAFKEGRDVLHDVAEFHARFIHIHPFRDGNGRTGRLLMNYLLLVNNEPIVSFPLEAKKEYVQALNYANTSDVRLSTQDINSFDKYIKLKHLQDRRNEFAEYLQNKNNTTREKGKSYKITKIEDGTDRIIDQMQYNQEHKDKYRYLTTFLKKHQIKIASKKAIADILNNYSKKDEDKQFAIGTIVADQTKFQEF